MDEYESLNHSQWDCKYHVIFIPKYRRKVLYGEIRQRLGEVFRRLNATGGRTNGSGDWPVIEIGHPVRARANSCYAILLSLLRV